MWSEQQQDEIAREYFRIGIHAGTRLPLPRDIQKATDYLTFLRLVPDGSGLQGFERTMADWARARA